MGGIPHWCFVGAKVVCVSAFDRRLRFWFERHPVVNATYTIRTVRETREGVFLRFQELRNVPWLYSDGPGECQFSVIRFRPVTRISDSEEDGVEAQIMRSKGRSLRDATETREPFKEKA